MFRDMGSVLGTRQLLFTSPCDLARLRSEKVPCSVAGQRSQQVGIEQPEWEERLAVSVHFSNFGTSSATHQTPSWASALVAAAQMVSVQGMQNEALEKHLTR